MIIIVKKQYGKWKPGQVISSRVSLYNKMLAEGKCWNNEDVTKLQARWYGTRPKPKGTMGQWANEILIEKYGTPEADAPKPNPRNKPTEAKPTEAKPTAKEKKPIKKR